MAPNNRRRARRVAKRSSAMATTGPKLAKQLSALRSLSAAKFAIKDDKLANEMRSVLKQLFDLSRVCDARGIGSGIPELCTDGFDGEQIWTMIKLETDPVLENAEKLEEGLAKHVNKSGDITLLNRPIVVEKAKSVKKSRDVVQNQDDENDTDDEFDNDEMMAEAERAGEDEEDTDDEDDMSEEGEDGDDEGEDERGAINFETELDDQFFSVDAMERFTEAAEEEEAESKRVEAEDKERAANKAIKGDADDDSYDDELEHKLLNNKAARTAGLRLPGEEEDDNSEEEDSDSDGDNEAGASYMHDDFFGMGGNQNNVSTKDKKEARQARKMAIDEDDEDDYEDEEAAIERMAAEDAADQEQEQVEEEDEELSPDATKFEIQQHKLKKQIKELEREAMGVKKWELSGEAISGSRPVNSLLEKGDLDVNVIKRSAPVITQESTESIEDVIRRRIKDSDFDDVERRMPMAVEADYHPQVELSTEKSKGGLGDEYAKDYQVSQLGHDTEDVTRRNKEHEELHEMFIGVCQKLDALSNFHYTPKPPKPTATVSSTAPAINMEEVTPLATSTASQSMPEQVFKADKGRAAPLGKSSGELESEDRKAIRRASKSAKRKRKKREDAERRVIHKLNPGLGNKYAKEKAFNELSASGGLNTGNKSVDRTGTDVDWTKSGQVFRHLQDEAIGESSGASAVPKRKATNTKTGAESMRL